MPPEQTLQPRTQVRASGDYHGAVALVTGGANGIGVGVSRRLAALGAHVVVADVDDVRGPEVAEEIGGAFVRTDVRELASVEAAVGVAVQRFGGLDLAFLNAGVSTGCGVGDDFDVQAYQRAMAINLDGVVYGVHAALPALRSRGGGAIVATASLAGLTAVPFDPIYAANKHAVVGLVRSLGAALAPENIRVNALCPSFAQTAIIEPIREVLAGARVPLLEVDEVVTAFLAAAGSDTGGQCWWVQPGRPSEPFAFRNVPGPRVAGEATGALTAEVQVTSSLRGMA